jgi:FKBP-type peptidyl-prolyl cis-trans isomerase FkpA
MKLRMAIMSILAGLVAWTGCEDPMVVPVMPPGFTPPKIPPPSAGGASEALGEGATMPGGGQRTVSKVISPPTPIGQPKTTSTGLIYETIKEGTGPECKPGDQIKVNYLGRLSTGEKFDASADRGGSYPLQIGVGGVVPGWDEGVPGMKVGESRRLTCSPQLGYGANGRPPVIPANATLVFDIDLLEITSSAPPPAAEKGTPNPAIKAAKPTMVPPEESHPEVKKSAEKAPK